jgi:multidrug efflux pump subunit AcrA (membrane-fusion protein)
VTGYWGHHSDWKIPRFSELTSNDKIEVIEWCDEHGVPEAECIACNAGLMPKGQLYGWCKEHGVHECVLHHPQTAQLKEIPVLLPSDLDQAARAIKLRSRTKNDPGCKMHLRRVQFPSIAAVDKVGIDIGLVDTGPIIESISATGEVVYDPTRLARLGCRTSGTVWQVKKNVGDEVHEGDMLALIDAAEVGKAKAELLDALAQADFHAETFDRLAPLARQQVIPRNRMLEVETALEQATIGFRRAEQALRNLGLSLNVEELKKLPDAERSGYIQFLGLSDALRSELPASMTSNNLIPLVASLDGIVIQREAVVGEVIDPSHTLFQIADTGNMWMILNVPMEEAKHIAVGQNMTFQADGDDYRHVGKVTWISTNVDSHTRTIKVRGELPNHDDRLRDESFGTGEILLRQEEDAILVPSTALHWEGCCHVAFVRDKDFFRNGSYKVFHTRSVRPGVVAKDHTEVIAGLLPGEVVVTEGSGVLRAELLKGNLGAG